MSQTASQSHPPRRAVQRLLGDPRVVLASVWAVVLLALAVRLYLAWKFNLRQPNSVARLVHGDEPSYNGIALELLHGLGFTGADRVPLYPLWVATLHALSGENYNVIPFAQAFLGTGTVLLTYLLGRRIFGHWPALAAALFAAVSHTLTWQTPYVLSEVLFTPAVLVVAITLWDAMERPSVGRFAWAGLWVGVADLVRPTLLFFPLFVAAAALALWGVRRGTRYAATYALVVALVIAPWTVRNYLRFHTFLPLATSNAALWLGSPEYYHLVRDQGYTYRRIWVEVIYPDDRSVPYPTNVEGDRYWSQRAMRSIRAEPLVYLKFAIEKLGTYWVGDPEGDWGNIHPLNYAWLRQGGRSVRDAVRILLERSLIVVAVAGAGLLWRQWRRLAPVYLLIGYCAALHAATVARARMSSPLQPLLLIVIAGAAAHLVAARGRARARHGAAVPSPAATS
jgi:hypothetical protein